MLKRGWVHVLATDAHNIDWRPPNLAAGRLAAAKIVGEEESWRLVKHRPQELAGCHFA
jgi:protein-tyrosine phosphatase